MTAAECRATKGQREGEVGGKELKWRQAWQSNGASSAERSWQNPGGGEQHDKDGNSCRARER